MITSRVTATKIKIDKRFDFMPHGLTWPANLDVISLMSVFGICWCWVGRGWLWFCLQVAVSEPRTDRSVQRQLAESQTHWDAAEEPDGAAQVCQRQWAVMTQRQQRDGFWFFSFLIPKKKVCNKDIFHTPYSSVFNFFLLFWVEDVDVFSLD